MTDCYEVTGRNKAFQFVSYLLHTLGWKSSWLQNWLQSG